MNGMKKMLYGNIINRIKEFLLKNLPEITYILFLATFLERFSYFLIIPFLSIYLAQNYHLSGLEIGLVVSTFAITSLFMSFIAAPFIDKIDKKVIIFIGLFLSAMSFLCFPLISKCLFFVIFALVNSIEVVFFRRHIKQFWRYPLIKCIRNLYLIYAIILLTFQLH